MLATALARSKQRSCQSAYHIKTDDLPVRLLDLSELHQEIPESRFGNNIVRGEYKHAIKLWGGVCL